MPVLRVIAFVCSLIFATGQIRAEIVLLAKTSVPGETTDRSGLEGKLEDGTPHNRLGSHGSSIAYTGHGNRYIMGSDRGPSDGATSYQCRMHFVDIVVNTGERPEVKFNLRDTVFLKDEKGRSFIGLSSAFDTAQPASSLRFDPEALRLGRDGTIFMSDEYGPYIYQFAASGKRLASIRVPEKFQIASPRAKETDEIAANKCGRVTNKGMEGLAITPDGRKLLGAMQAPLIQDGGSKGIGCRLLEIELATGASREFLYPLAEAGLGLGEILAVNDTEFLAIERDSKRGKEARDKRIYRIDIASATDVSGRAMLPKDRVPDGIAAVKKEVFLDLVEPRHGLAGPDFPAKAEGLTFGPDLPDGRRLLIVTTDNDFHADQPTWIYAFAIDKDSLPRYQPQVFDGKK